MTIAEQIYTLVRVLPPDQASKVLIFAEAIHAKFMNVGKSIDTAQPNSSKAVSFKASLHRLHQLTQDLPTVDPVALIQAGRDALDARGGF